MNDDNFIADCETEARRKRDELDTIPEDSQIRTAKDQADEVIKEVEMSRV